MVSGCKNRLGTKKEREVKSEIREIKIAAG